MKLAVEEDTYLLEITRELHPAILVLCIIGSELVNFGNFTARPSQRRYRNKYQDRSSSANSVDPDQTASVEQSDQDPHCLSISGNY